MKINDFGFFLGNKKYGENSMIVFIFSKKNGLIKSFSKFKNKQLQSVMLLDKVSFEWQSKDRDSLGFIKITSEKSYKSKDFFCSLIKSSASELCLKFLPLWEENIAIFNNLEKLIDQCKGDISEVILNYVWWEILFLKNTGYGLNLNECVVTGSKENLYFISPRTGNCVSYEIGKQYSKKLFKIPQCIKNKKIPKNFSDFLDALKITSYFLKKNFNYDLSKLVFRNHLMKNLTHL